jgi:hypothetical protein
LEEVRTGFLRSDSQSAFFRYRLDIAGAMNDANNDSLIGLLQIIDCVIPAKYDPQARCKKWPRRTGSGKLSGLAKSSLNLKQKIRSN